jgi:hypothetical protein
MLIFNSKVLNSRVRSQFETLCRLVVKELNRDTAINCTGHSNLGCILYETFLVVSPGEMSYLGAVPYVKQHF